MVKEQASEKAQRLEVQQLQSKMKQAVAASSSAVVTAKQGLQQITEAHLLELTVRLMPHSHARCGLQLDGSGSKMGQFDLGRWKWREPARDFIIETGAKLCIQPEHDVCPCCCRRLSDPPCR